MHDFLDSHYGTDGDDVLRRRLANGADPNERLGPQQETPLHVATRRRRLSAVEILLESGAEIDARTKGDKTAYAHAVRRGFHEVAELLEARGADTALNDADRLAVAISKGELDQARALLKEHPGVAKTGNPEEDRLLADIAGRNDSEPVKMLIEAGADLAAHGLDTGTPLHIACWFGQPDNARLLLDAGAPVDGFDATHESTPIGWVAHGSRYSGGIDDRQERYVALARMLLDAGASLEYPGQTDGGYFQRLLADASPKVAEVLRGAQGR